MSNEKMTGKELIMMVLKSAKKPLSVSDIWDIAKEKGYAKKYAPGTDAKQKERQIGAEILRWYQRGDSPLERFEKGEKGRDITYSLNDKEEIEDKNVKKNEIVVKDFSAEWCGPCQMQTPIIKDLEKEYNGKIKFEVIDVDKNEQIAEKYKVSSIPTVIIEKNGIVVKRHVGVVSKKELIKELDKF
ncbi:MAG: thioredoxin [Euryarchaeota archaeon]|nr:thioredoxin [Euryarchaeota archaeon]MCG2735627.1 thioredoxin [Candidatus Methanoperedenaceae archaeon]